MWETRSIKNFLKEYVDNYKTLCFILYSWNKDNLVKNIVVGILQCV